MKLHTILSLDFLSYHSQLFKDDNLTVFTDSGHGWLTPGKRAGGIRENEFNSAVEDKITLLLQYLNIKPILLAPEWNDVSLETRKSRERYSYVHDNIDPDRVCGISIHADAFKSSDANGLRLYHYASSQKGMLLADLIGNSYDYYHEELDLGIEYGNVRTANFYMLRETISPFVLIEYGFMTNPSDVEKLKSDEFRNYAAAVTVCGIVNYFKSILKK